MPESARAASWNQRWYARRASLLLLPFSGLFRVAVALRRAAYQLKLRPQGHPGVPVIVIGNLTVGGTGKTPLTLWLADQLSAEGRKVGIATRGYGGKVTGPELVPPGADPKRYGDEACLLANAGRHPVCVGRNRLAAACKLAQASCQLVLCDDGLQHLALQRDFEIVVVDAQRGFGNAAMLPAGPLREPLSRLTHANAIVLAGEGMVPGLPVTTPALRFRLQPTSPRAIVSGDTRDWAAWQGQLVHAVAGIGHPQRFFDMLTTRGLRVLPHAFADHHAFCAQDLTFDDAYPVLMTEKDVVKCQAFADQRMWAVPVQPHFEAQDKERLLALVRKCL